MTAFPNHSSIEPTSLAGLQHLGKYLASIQLESGAIPGNKDGSHDPWDHLEAVMGLTTLGFRSEAELGLKWMRAHQNSDGSWCNKYLDTTVLEGNKQTNFSTYLAVAVWHFYLIYQDQKLLSLHWESIVKGINFALSMQEPHGAISWNLDEDGIVENDYLLTGCSSIAKSIECGIAISKVLQKDTETDAWQEAHAQLLLAINSPEGIFDKTKDRSRFSMDWYYPILAGVSDPATIARLTNQLKQNFWIEGLGIKCVSDEPWVTVAETSECSLALLKLGEHAFAEELLLNAISIVNEDNIPYMGFQYEEGIYWPDETPSWTSAACILAADANYQLTGASNLFISTQA